MQELKDKAISIKGKQYVLVSDRILFFNENFPNGSITTELVSEPTSDHIVIKATVLPDSNSPQRIFTGYSQAKIGDGMVNKTAALENAETSAVGRALATMGIGVLDSVASADEMAKAGVKEDKEPTGLRSKCQTCGAEMVEKSGNTNGKAWTGLFCPNAKKGEPGHKPVWL